MKNETELMICLLGQTTLLAEWASLAGDKYRSALGFPWRFTDDVDAAQVIAWDGVLTAKSSFYFTPVVERLKEGKAVLLLQREAWTLFNDDPFLTFVDPKDLKVVELASGNALPEDLLAALIAAREKLGHV